jgi:hypothetical protein
MVKLIRFSAATLALGIAVALAWGIVRWFEDVNWHR